MTDCASSLIGDGAKKKFLGLSLAYKARSLCFFLSACGMAQRKRCPGGRPSQGVQPHRVCSDPETWGGRANNCPNKG